MQVKITIKLFFMQLVVFARASLFTEVWLLRDHGELLPKLNSVSYCNPSAGGKLDNLFVDKCSEQSCVLNLETTYNGHVTFTPSVTALASLTVYALGNEASTSLLHSMPHNLTANEKVKLPFMLMFPHHFRNTTGVYLLDVDVTVNRTKQVCERFTVTLSASEKIHAPLLTLVAVKFLSSSLRMSYGV